MDHPRSDELEERHKAFERGHEHTRSLVHRLAYEIRSDARPEECPLGLFGIYPILVGAERKELWIYRQLLERQGRAVRDRQRQRLREYDALILEALTLLLTTEAKAVTISNEGEVRAAT